MGSAYKCDICRRLFSGTKPLSVLVKCMHRSLGGISEEWKDLCPDCGKKVLEALKPVNDTESVTDEEEE